MIVAALAVGGFAAFSPKPASEATSTTAVALVADGRGVSTGRLLASSFANDAADQSYLTVPSTTRSTFVIEADPVDPVTPDPREGDASTAEAEAPSDGSVSWPSGSTCEATWYGPGFEGKPTANGETFDPGAFTAALHDVAFNTTVKVTRTDTGAVTLVRVNDRGPYEWDSGWQRHPTRCIDLSEAAMAALGGIEDGVIPVTITY